jgi:8-oxo-dGTP diphosphatase
MIQSAHLTHAGGVVYRIEQAKPKFLVVTARRDPQAWVLPKGHIERGETAEEAAIREVREEAGVSAVIVQQLDDVRISFSEFAAIWPPTLARIL